jgi:hypothetical protein
MRINNVLYMKEMMSGRYYGAAGVWATVAALRDAGDGPDAPDADPDDCDDTPAAASRSTAEPRLPLTPRSSHLLMMKC